MKFVCIDRPNGNHVYIYSDREDDGICPNCSECVVKDEATGQCSKDRYFCRKHATDGRHTFFFCLDHVRTKKQAKQLIKLTIDAYQRSANIRADTASIANNVIELAIHNTRNLNAEINNKLLSLVDERKLMDAADKMVFIENAVRNSPGRFAREILNILKSTTQIMHEYNVVDFLNANIALKPADFGRHRAHTLYVMSFYLYEQEFKKNGILVQAENSWDEIWVHWTTARTAVAQLFDNCLKYCSPKEPMSVKFRKREANGHQFLDMVFEMTSVYFTNREAPGLLSPGVRGSYSDKVRGRGKGLGLGIIQRMMELNNGSFHFKSDEQTHFVEEGVPYSHNEFVLSFIRL